MGHAYSYNCVECLRDMENKLRNATEPVYAYEIVATPRARALVVVLARDE